MLYNYHVPQIYTYFLYHGRKHIIILYIRENVPDHAAVGDSLFR